MFWSLEEICGYLGEEERQKAKEEPEVCLVSMLMLIKEYLPETCATLRFSIDMTTEDEQLEEARKKLKKAR